MVPPDTFIEVTGNNWYEHGVLCKWHETRPSGLMAVEQGTHDFEAVNGLIPIYKTTPPINLSLDQKEMLLYLLRSSKAGKFEYGSGDESTEFSEIPSEMSSKGD